MGLEYYRDQWIWLLSISDMYESTSANWIRKIALQKKGSTTIPIRNFFVSVYTHINKKIVKMLATAQGLSTVFPRSKILGMKLALTLLMLMIDLIPDQIFFILFLLHKK